MNRRRALSALGAIPLLALAQAPARTYRIAILEQWYSTSPSGPARRLVEGLAELGYREGRNLSYEWRHAAGDHARLARLAEEISAMRPDAIVSMGGISTRAISKATTTTPILAWVEDPVKAGYAHPSLLPKGNITGLADQSDERARKGLELLKSLMPDTSRVGALLPLDNPYAAALTAELEHSARHLGVDVVVERFTTRADIERGFSAFERRGIRAAIAWPAPGLITLAETVQLALRHRIGLMGEGIVARFGVLLSFSPEIDARRMAIQLDKILRGVPVPQIPFEIPVRFLVSINRKTASALGLAIPADIYLRADEVFDDWAEDRK